MRGAALLLVATGCTKIFGIVETSQEPQIDAQYFDAPADAPFMCPGIGTSPEFSRLLHQIPENCFEYTASAMTGRAIARCSDPRGAGIFEGSLDGGFAPAAGLDLGSSISINNVRMSPEGDQVFLAQHPSMAAFGQIVIYEQPGGVGTPWQATSGLSFGDVVDAYVQVGTPSLGYPRRMMVMQADGSPTELSVEKAGAITVIQAYAPADLAVSGFAGPPGISPDGLRLLYAGYDPMSGTPTMMYADRASVDVVFGQPRALTELPFVTDAFMTKDCERVYFSAVGSLLWVQQR